ncbi:hypothetical protein CK203_076652 [Vitis vinifera]|uniref:Reverse transcriptase zinc-binding domain-containing protein n=1 Tax=Vitis vinifera TaxID=29760 RepID=A0A438EYE1_VITVI|nr:hypothetical protein CK203_076652 [Vitis vinifera]
MGAMDSRGVVGGIVVLWDNRVLDLVYLQKGMFSISCIFKNCEDDFMWTFTGVYGPTMRRDRECFWDERAQQRREPVSTHFPILLDGGGLRRGPSLFRFENMWLKVEGFKDLLKSWWEGDSFSGSSSFILVEKLKVLKSKLKEWNRDIFGRVEYRKNLALEQVEFWDAKEKNSILSLEELEA